MLAVLRVRFDTNADQSSVWSDAVFNSWLDPSVPYSLAHYWKTASVGAFDMRYVLFPPLVLGDPRQGAPAGSGNDVIRPRLIDGVIAQARFILGFDADPFDQLLLWFAQPTDMFGMTSHSVTGASGWPKSVGVAVVDVSSPFDSLCQEVGHAFGLDHPVAAFRPAGYTEQDLDYGSPYDVMASQRYLGYASSFVRAPDPRLPDGTPDAAGGTPPQRVVGPLLSGAQLAARVPWFSLTPFLRRVPARPGTTGTSLRVLALDQAAEVAGNWPQHPFVVLVDTQVGQTYSVELRRGRGYDAVIGTMDPNLNRPAAGLVVHHHHVPSGRMFYDGVLPLPAVAGDLDWHSWAGHFAIRVRDVADDLSWADIVIGGDDFWRQWDVELERLSDSQHEEVVERRQVAVNIPCVEGMYSVEKIRRSYETTLVASSFGFERPGYEWSANGVVLAPSAAPAWKSVTFTTEVSTPDPDPANRGGTVGLSPVTLRYTLAGNRLTLRSGAQDGNFIVEVKVSASETDPGVLRSVVPTVNAADRLDYRCLRYAWEDAYDEAFRRCFDFGTRFRELEDLRVVINPGDPPPYAVRPDELEEVLGLELLALRGEVDRGEVVRYMATRYQIPEQVIRGRLDRQR